MSSLGWGLYLRVLAFRFTAKFGFVSKVFFFFCVVGV